MPTSSTFSGDKLVGGPQAGLIVGRADLVSRLRRDPLARAMRPDKVTLAAVAATLGLYRAGWARREIPVWIAIAADAAELRDRAEWLASDLRGGGTPADVTVVETRATVGGGALPGETLPSVGLRLRLRSPQRAWPGLRRGDPCVIARIEDGPSSSTCGPSTRSDDAALGGALAGRSGTPTRR